MNRLEGTLITFRKYCPLLWNLTSRDFKLKYRRSFLGVAWSILNPLLMMLVLTQVFGLLLKVKIDNFPVYYIIGSTMWNFFADATQVSMTSVTGNAALIKKVYVPKYIFPLSKCLFSLENFFFSLIAVVLVMLFQQFVPTPTAVLVVIPILYCFLFAIGVSLVLSALVVFFRDILHLYGILLTVWMYLTPIIYPVSLIEDSPFIYGIVRCNPLYYFVEYFRSLLMYNTIPDLKWNLICIGFSLGSLVLGLFVFKRAQDKFILHI